MNRMSWMLISALSAMLLSVPAVAQEGRGQHGQGHDAFHHWYETLRQPGTGFSCRNGRDCRPTIARSRGAIIEVMIDGEWVVVPSDKILNATAPDLSTHVCSMNGPPWQPKLIFCVILGIGV